MPKPRLILKLFAKNISFRTVLISTLKKACPIYILLNHLYIGEIHACSDVGV